MASSIDKPVIHFDSHVQLKPLLKLCASMVSTCYEKFSSSKTIYWLQCFNILVLNTTYSLALNESPVH